MCFVDLLMSCVWRRQCAHGARKFDWRLDYLAHISSSRVMILLLYLSCADTVLLY